MSATESMASELQLRSFKRKMHLGESEREEEVRGKKIGGRGHTVLLFIEPEERQARRSHVECR